MSTTAPRLVAWLRVAFLPVILLQEHTLEHPTAGLQTFQVLSWAALAYAVCALVHELVAPQTVRLVPYALADMTVLALLAWSSGGASSALLLTLSLPPLMAAFLARPHEVVVLAVLSVAATLAVVLVPSVVTHPSTPAAAAAHALDPAWRACLAIAMSVFVTRRNRRVQELATLHRALTMQLVSAEERAQRQLAYALHDGPVQGLLAAQQDLASARRGRAEHLERAGATVGAVLGQLRSQILELRPTVLDTSGLEAALRTVAREGAVEGGPVVHVSVAAGAVAGEEDVLFAVGRELLRNALRHADASHVRVAVRRRGEWVVLTCTDDGRGISAGDRREALTAGHVGLAACKERVEGRGGSLSFDWRHGGGTVVTASLRTRAAVTTGPQPARRSLSLALEQD